MLFIVKFLILYNQMTLKIIKLNNKNGKLNKNTIK